MKRNITLAIDDTLLKKARSVATKRGSSISSMLANELEKLVSREAEYEQAKARALARFKAPFHLGGKGIEDREALHDRKNLR